MFAKLSSENRIKERLAKLDCTVSFICGLAGIPDSRLGQALRGLKPLANDDADLLLERLDELDDLVRAFEPVPVALTKPQKIRQLLEEIRDQRNEAYCVRFGRSFFVSNTGELRTSFLLQGTPMDRITAEKVATVLRSDYPDAEIVRNSFASWTQ